MQHIDTMYNYFSAALVTLKNHGGTFTPAGSVVKTHELYGYLVGGVVPSSIVGRADNNHAVLANHLRNFVTQHEGILRADPSLYLGTWCHEGNVYIDVVEFVGNRAAALELARERGEEAVWDCRSGNEVNAEVE
jgi:hypothetical protein